MKLKELISPVILTAAMSLATSCITQDNSLDLSKDITLDMGLGKDGQISIPLGDLGRITMDSLIKIDNDDPNSALHILENGLYAITESGEFNKEEINLSPLGIDLGNPVSETIKLDFENIPDNILVGNRFSASFQSKSELTISEIVDKAILSVSRLEPVRPADVGLNIKFTGLPANLQQVIFDNVGISFPECLKIQYTGTDTRFSIVKNAIVINGIFTLMELKDGEFSVSGISLCGIEFTKPLPVRESGGEKRIEYSSDVRYSGKFTVTGENITVGDLKSVSMSLNMPIGHIDVKRFDGSIFPSINRIRGSFAFNLSDDLEFLKSKDNTFDMSDISINLDLKSNLSAPLLVNMSIDSKSSDGQWIARGISADKGAFRIPSAPVGTTRETKVRISNCEESSQDADVNVMASRLGELVRTIPDSILFEVDARTDISDSVIHTILFGEKTFLSGKYKAEIPFRFNSIRLNYSKLQDISKDLDEIREKLISAKLQIQIDITNTVPMDLCLSLSPKDSNGNELPADKIHFSDVTVPAGTPEDPTVKTVDFSGFAGRDIIRDWSSISLSLHCESDKPLELRNTEGIEMHNVRLIMSDINLNLSGK